jgi:hypothetical protein
MICHGPNCRSEQLIEAHIIPQGFARFIRGPDANVKLTPERVSEAKPQLGEYDPDILCADCDRKLGLDDEYGLEVCRRYDAEHILVGDKVFEMKNVDCERFSKFVLSVLWRASISKRKSFAAVDLGPYEDVARDVLFGARKLENMRAFEVILQRYQSVHLDPSKIYFHPSRCPFGDLNAYGFGLAGFRIMAKLDNRSFRQDWWPMVINRSNVFRGTFAVFEECSEFQSIVSIVHANERRENRFQ